MRNVKPRPGRAAVAAGLLAFVIYLPSLRNGFALDDVRDVRDNPAITDASGPLDVLLSPYRGDVPPGRSPYRPITSLSFWMNWRLSDGAASSFHVVNVLLHSLATVLVVYLLVALGASGTAGLAGGLIFAIHPVHIEAVAGIVGRADVLMTIFCLLGAIAFLARGLGPVARASIVALAYALALGAKENGVALPAMLALLLVLPRRPTSTEAARPAPLRRELLVLAPTILVLGAYLGLRHAVLGTLVQRDTAPYITMLPTPERVMTAVANMLQLGRLLLFPADLVADYGPRVINPVGLASPRLWLGGLTAALTIALAVLLYRRARLASVALAWVVLSTLVVSNLVIPIGVWVAERTLYLPSVGVSLGTAALVGSLTQAPTRVLRGLWAGLALVVVLASWKILDRTPAWRDTETVLRTLAEEHPESFRGEWWLAQSLTEVGDYTSGLRWFEEARQASPNDLGLALDYARALLLAGQPQKAESLVEPLPPSDPARFVYLAQSRLMTGRREAARAAVRAGLARFPGDARLLAQAHELGVERGKHDVCNPV